MVKLRQREDGTTYTDTDNGYKYRLQVADLLDKWKINPEKYGLENNYEIIATLLGHKAAPNWNWDYTTEHDRVLQAIIAHGRPILEMLLIQRGLK